MYIQIYVYETRATTEEEPVDNIRSACISSTYMINLYTLTQTYKQTKPHLHTHTHINTYNIYT